MINKFRSETVIKILAIIAFVLITLMLIIVYKTPLADGYELSIYDAFPLYFWLFLITSLVCGIGIFLYLAFTNQKSKWWIAGFIVVIFCLSILIFIPTFRGYLLSNTSDLNFHHRLTFDILESGHVSSLNFYPGIHILSAQLIVVTGMTERAVVDLTTILFVFLYLIGMYLLAYLLTKSHTCGLFIISFASIPVFQSALIYYHPSGTSVLLIPIFLYLYHQTKLRSFHKREIILCILLLASFITFFHPITSFLLIVILLTFGLMTTLYKRIKYMINDTSTFTYQLLGNYSNITLIIILIFFLWYSSFSVFKAGIIQTLNWLFYQLGGVSTAMGHLQIVTKIQLTFSQIIELIFNRYGTVIIFFILSLIAIIIILKHMKSKSVYFNFLLLTYGVQLAVLSLISIFFFFGQIMETDPLRILRFPIFISVIVNGLFLDYYIRLKNETRKKFSPSPVIVVLIALLILISCCVSILNFYPSPRVADANSQTTYMDLAVTNWLLGNKEKMFGLLTTYCYVSQYQLLILNHSEIRYGNGLIKSAEIPPHFGYNISINNTLDIALKNNNGYMVICPLDRIFPLVVPTNARLKITYQYSQKDFDRLESDQNVNKIYINGEVETWEVYSNR